MVSKLVHRLFGGGFHLNSTSKALERLTVTTVRLIHPISLYMGVSQNSGCSPQIIHFNRVFPLSTIHFGGTPIFGNIQMGYWEFLCFSGYIPYCQALIFQNSVQPPLPLLVVLETVPYSRLDGWVKWGFAAKTDRCHPSEIYEIREVAENTTIFV